MSSADDMNDRARLAPERWTRICAVLDHLSESSDDDRESALAEACRQHRLERAEVERFLRCSPDAAFLERLPDDLLSEVFAASEDADLVARFPPGSTLQGRHRVLAFLGSGGMGDVYLAQDLALAQPVALKFLSADLARRPEAVALLVNEVTIARRIAHSGVCRVHDLGSADGIPFVSMEFIEGETLERRLAREGPPSLDDARSWVYQLCEALAAAHDQGVLHCDLKPSNVMLTTDGRVKITDFGLAGLITALEGRASKFGTAAYLAPERLAGAPPTCASDVYALGLLLLDLFAGKNAAPPVGPDRSPSARRLTARAAMRTARVPRDVADLIESCLRADPHARPASARRVLDELKNAVWEREATPVKSLAVTRRQVRALVVFAIAGLVLVVKWSPHVQLAFLAPAVSSPEALANRARRLLGELGYTAPHDAVSGFFVERDTVASMVARNASAPAWQVGGSHGPVLRYFYRESDRSIVGSFDAWGTEPRLPWRDTERGVELAPDGRLLAFHGAPPTDKKTVRSPADAWRVLQAATLKRSDEGHLESGRADWPVDFPVATTTETRISTRRMRFAAFWNIASLVIGLASAVVFARRAWRRGHVDVRATRHIAVSFLVVVPVTWLLVTHHSLTTDHMQNVLRLLAWTLWVSGAAAVFFAATTAHAPRWWPVAFGAGLQWIRRGKVDASFGMDLLAGTVAGIALALIDRLYVMLPAAFGWAPPSPVTIFAYQNLQSEVLAGPGPAFGYLLYQAAHLGWLIAVNTWLLCLFKLTLKHTSAAVGAKIALDTYVVAPATNPWMLGATYTAVGFGASLWLFIHHGFVGMFVAAFVRATLLNYPLSFSVNTWFWAWSCLAFLAVGSLLSAGAWIAPDRVGQAEFRN
jgi:predicted Ser/Thr protein kinase